MKRSAMKPAGSRKCKSCRETFQPRNTMQVVCSPACAGQFAQRLRQRQEAAAQREERRTDRARREKLKRRADWMADAQRAFNAWVRARDAGMPCICCGKPFEPGKLGGSMDAGHYLSRGSAPHLRFDERNVFGQRKNCNRPGGTTRAAFRAGVIARIGLAAVEALEADQEPRNYTAEDLRAIRDHYRNLSKALASKEA